MRSSWPVLVCVIALSGCTTQRVAETQVYDPWESANRRSYAVLDTADRYVVRPAAQGYAAVLPDAVERGLVNFFTNLRAPVSSLCGLLQGKAKRGGTDFARFLLNSTFGVAGLFDVARHMGLEFQDEDLGQVFATWGYRQSRALYLPLVGPTTVRDLPGDLINTFFAPRWLLGDSYGWELATTDSLSRRAALLTATDGRDAVALDAYAFTMTANHQRRLDRLYDGSPPIEDFLEGIEDFADEEEEPDAP